MIGEKFNRMTIVEDLGMVIQKSGRSKRMVKAICECGNIRTPALSDLKNGRTKSCGCYIKENRSIISVRHGLIKHPLYRVWGSIKGRCKENCKDKPYYFDKNISMCEEWKDNFEKFYNWAIENGYKRGLQIDRILGDKDYSPTNCRFITARENTNNRSNTVFLTLANETNPISIWAEKLNIGIETLRRRVFDYKWSHEKALTTPARKYG